MKKQIFTVAGVFGILCAASMAATPADTWIAQLQSYQTSDSAQPLVSQVSVAVAALNSLQTGGSVTLAGDVTGAAGANTVVKIRNHLVSTDTPTVNNLAYTWDTGTNSFKLKLVVTQGNVYPNSIDYSGAFPIITGIQNNAFDGAAPSVQGQYYSWDTGGSKFILTAAPAPVGSLAGDVTGTIGANTVGKIQGRTVDNTAPSIDGQYLSWSTGGSKYVLTAAPSNTAVAFHPGYQTGRYYSTPLVGTTTILNLSTGTLYAMPFYVPASHTFTSIAFKCGASAGINVELGVYANSNGIPGNLELDAGQVSATVGGGIEISGLSLTLSQGWHWLAISSSGSVTNSVGFTAASNTIISYFLGASTLATVDTLYGGINAVWVYSANNLPLTFPTVIYGTSTQPQIWLKG